MSSIYYPPGVTGNEVQIAGTRYGGSPERQVGECSNAGELVITPVRDRLSRLLRRVRGVICTFEGGGVEGDLEFSSHTAYFDWTCPSCGASHTEEIDAEEFGPDPDYAHDTRFDF